MVLSIISSDKKHRNFEVNLSACASSDEDPNPEPKLSDGFGSETFSRIRIWKKSFRDREALDPKRI
jgi:hypothetical protein